MDQAELTSVFCTRPQNFAWLLGAGASATAGLPTAQDIIWDLKRRYYARQENQEITRQDMQVEAVRDRIQQYMDSMGFPEQWAPDEYTTYFEKIFGRDRERQRNYLAAQLAEDKVTLSVGTRVLAALMAAGLTRVVFTTNFDTVLEKAVADVAARSLSAYHLEGSHSAVQALNNEEYPFYCKLHGDFRYDSIKNLSVDLATQNDHLSECLTKASSRFGFIVAGYSGRDESVMALFRQALALKGAFPHGFYWTGMKQIGPPPPVSRFLAEAQQAGVNAHFVPIETFDAFMLRLWRSIENKPREYDAKVRRTRIASIAIPLPPTGTNPPLLRLNALPLLSLPRACQAITFGTPKDWDDLRTAARKEGNLILTKTDKVWCWGTNDFLANEFSDISSIEPCDLSAALANLDQHTLLKAFLAEAAARALARAKPLIVRTERSGTYLIADRHGDDHAVLEPLRGAVGTPFGDIAGLFTPVSDDHPEPRQVAWAEAVRVSVDVKGQKTWLLLTPTIWIWPRWGREAAEEFLDKRGGGRFNRQHNELLTAWIHVLLGTNEQAATVRVSAFEQGSDIENPSFEIASRTAYARRIAV